MRALQRIIAPIGVLLAFVAAAVALRWLTAGSWEAVAGAERATFDALLLFVGSVLVWGAFAWLALSVVLVVLSAIPGALGAASTAIAERITPTFCRRAVRIILGITVVAGPVAGTAPAHAAGADTPNTSYTLSVDRPMDSDQALDVDRPMADTDANRVAPNVGSTELPNVDRPMSQDPLNRPPTRDNDNQESERQQTHVVKRGDTLWDIAKDRLPEGASDAEISQEWQRWYEQNRDVIGEDPDLILPGQVFQTPPEDS